MQTELSETVKAIYAWHESEEAKRSGPHNGRLGASQIGHPCERYLWYSFRGLVKSKFDGRMLRLFETGHLEEPRLVNELRGIGCEVFEVDLETGKQFEFTAHDGHFVCHPDAVAVGIPEAPATWHICEFKTMGGTEDESSKDFEKCIKNGVKLAKPQHYAQMMVGMGLFNLTRALYIAKKKSTDELYSERIKFDKDEFEKLMDRAHRVINASVPLERCAGRPDDFRCKFCDAYNLCWSAGQFAVNIPEKTCRSCCHFTPVEKAEWKCEYNKKIIPFAEQNCDCPFHLLLPGLISFAEPQDAGEDFIEFKNTDDNYVWTHGHKEGQWTTEQLMTTEIEKIKSNVIPLIDRYPTEDSRLLWDGEYDQDIVNQKFCEILKVSDIDQIPEPTNSEKTETTTAHEFLNKYLFVIYHDSNDHCAIWEGIE